LDIETDTLVIPEHVVADGKSMKSIGDME